MMESAESIERAGMRWLAGAGILALLLTIALGVIDCLSGFGPSERKEGGDLEGIRKAQSNMASVEVDPRQTRSYLPGGGQ